jgi:hypothetical protein
MAQAKFLCIDKTGVETFTVHLEPVVEDICPKCRKMTSEEICIGSSDVDKHAVTRVPNGDRSFFKDMPHASIFLSVLTPEAAAEFEVGKVTVVSFAIERADAPNALRSVP